MNDLELLGVKIQYGVMCPDGDVAPVSENHADGAYYAGLDALDCDYSHGCVGRHRVVSRVLSAWSEA